MKSREEITKQARELCDRLDTECALFISGYVRGYEDCQKEYEKDGLDREENNG